MRDKNGRSIDDLRIGKMMEEFGFNPESSTSTARALILNLVRSAYGAEAAREFMRQMNLEKNRGLEPHVVMDEFKEQQAILHRQKIEGVGTAETQLSLFDLPTHEVGDVFLATGTFHQKKSRRA